MHGQAMHPPQDDAFDASWHMKATNSDAERIVPENPNTAPARPRRHKKAPSDSSSHSQSTAMPNPRPSCEKRSSAARKSPTELRRPSIGSSSEDSTSKTRSRGHGSRHSSRRTSRTFVDPSRPTRHYRLNSSHTVPTANRNDIDDVIALHFRSCSLFENPTYYSPMASPTGAGHLEMAMGSNHPHVVPEWTDDIASDHHHVIENKPSKTNEETIASPERENTTMHWMSPSTRKRQYEKIDRANSGLRGFVAKVVPRCVSGPPPEKFYEKDKSDTGSVRRYRMSDDCEDEEERDTKQGKDLEKSTSTVRPRQIRTLDRAATVPQAKTKRWGCF